LSSSSSTNYSNDHDVARPASPHDISGGNITTSPGNTHVSDKYKSFKENRPQSGAITKTNRSYFSSNEGYQYRTDSSLNHTIIEGHPAKCCLCRTEIVEKCGACGVALCKVPRGNRKFSCHEVWHKENPHHPELQEIKRDDKRERAKRKREDDEETVNEEHVGEDVPTTKRVKANKHKATGGDEALPETAAQKSNPDIVPPSSKAKGKGKEKGKEVQAKV
jgi:hypothetical protein